MHANLEPFRRGSRPRHGIREHDRIAARPCRPDTRYGREQGAARYPDERNVARGAREPRSQIDGPAVDTREIGAIARSAHRERRRGARAE
jgi:hypothetical protein